MRIERLTYNKIKVFLTIDDLLERGLSKEDIWKDSLKWHQLFHEMLEEASDEYGVHFEGSVAVEIYSMHAQGMIMIVTMEEQDEEGFHEGFIDMEVMAKEREDILFEFQDIEEVIHLSKRLIGQNSSGGSLYSMKEKYYLFFSGDGVKDSSCFIAIMSEYGHASLESIHLLNEYGKLIIKEHAIETLVKYFAS